MRAIREIIIHCSATHPGMDIGAKEIREWHTAKGWQDIGYHFVIRRNGAVETGRGIEQVGAHVEGHNQYSIGICLVGGVVWAMDDRYVKHEDLQAAVTDIKQTIQSSAREVQCEALLDDIARLEQIIAFRARSNEDASLERIILDSDKRKLDQYGGCPQ